MKISKTSQIFFLTLTMILFINISNAKQNNNSTQTEVLKSSQQLENFHLNPSFGNFVSLYR